MTKLNEIYTLTEAYDEMYENGEPSMKMFIHADLLCIVNRMSHSGHLNGYVGIPRSHSLHGEDSTVELDVHGGVTYSGTLSHLIDVDIFKNNWYFGFDCSHAGDLSPIDILPAYGDIPYQKVYRSMEYVIEQTKTLAEQLKEVF